MFAWLDIRGKWKVLDTTKKEITLRSEKMHVIPRINTTVQHTWHFVSYVEIHFNLNPGRRFRIVQ